MRLATTHTTNPLHAFLAYRFHFNGKETDNEVYGEGNSYNFGSRSIYNGRLGRFVSIDPRFRDFPYMSPYCFAANDPIRFIDVDGEGPGDRISAARSHKGTAYKKEEGNLRTESTQQGLRYMDCSELVCRVLAADNFTKGVKSMNTTALIDYMESDGNWEEVSTPSSGDVILWEGHTALVVEYNATTKEVTVIHATRYKNSEGIMVESVVEEKYSLKYYSKKRAVFYRPINDMPDGDLNSPKAGTQAARPMTLREAERLFYQNFQINPNVKKEMAAFNGTGNSESSVKRKIEFKFIPPELDGDPEEVSPELME